MPEILVREMYDRAYEATCTTDGCDAAGVSFARDDLFQTDDEVAACPECEEPLSFPSAAVEPVGSAIETQGDPLPILRKAALALDDQRADMVARRDKVGLANGSADLALFQSDLAAVQDAVRRDLARLMLEDHGDKRGNPKLEVDGLGVVDVPGGREWKKWESMKLMRRLAFSAILDDGGEVRADMAPSDVVEAVLEKLTACLPTGESVAWKVGQLDKATGEWSGLRGQGIDPEDYGDFEDKPRLAKIPKRDRTAGGAR